MFPRIFATAILAAMLAVSAFAQSSISAPDAVKAGSTFELKVTAPPPNPVVSIVKTSHEAGRGPSYSYVSKQLTAKLRAPDEPGDDYEIRLLEGHGKIVLRRPIQVTGVDASVETPVSVAAGAAFDVSWTGPANHNDQVRLAEVGSAGDTRLAYAYTSRNPVKLTAPDKPGTYEVRYVTGQSLSILASSTITVGGTAATVTAPAEIEARAPLSIGWDGPNNPGDVINVVSKKDGKRYAWGYPGNGNPVRVSAPRVPGEYEIRYQTGQSRAVLARAPLRVTPASAQPGSLVVQAKAAAAASSGAIEIILDASGSMLQRMGSERRIEVAKSTLTELTSEVIPAGAPFALRVFGKEVGSCQTDLEIPLAPLNAAAVAAKIGGIEAKNNAKTPIAASLSKVIADLRGAKGELTVIVITDGEETCDGDPAAAIEALRGAGVDVRVNIVGFAIDDEGLAEQFEDWASVGGGAYFDADDAAGLSAALSGALQQPFEVVDGSGAVVARGVAGGDAVELSAGSYSLRAGGAAQPVKIDAGRTTTVNLP